MVWMNARILMLAASPALLGGGPEELSTVKVVYLVPMRLGLDHYLVNHLTRGGVYQVTTDPKKADAVFTDRLGEAFEKRLAEWRAPASPEQPADAAKKEDRPKADSARKESMRPSASFGGGRGTIFLISRKSGDVIWSGFELPRNVDPEQMDKSAERLVKQLQKDLNPAK
jgi:hypothetical protein